MRSSTFPTPLPEWLAYSPCAKGVATLYQTAVYIRNKWYDLPGRSHKVNRPVISIGAIRAGGTGKTPSAILVGTRLIDMGYIVSFLSRGYGRNSKHLHIVAPQQTTSWKLIGDEPAMIHSTLPNSWLAIHSNRQRAAQEIECQLPANSVFILDDGFQHRNIRRDLDIVCLHEQTFEEKMIPKGYLREPISSLSRAHAAFIIANPEKTLYLEEKLRDRYPKLELFGLNYKPKCYINAQTGRSADTPPYLTPVALCGIARPGRFFDTLRESGVYPCKEIVFPDHHDFTEYNVSSIRDIYLHGLVTTEKDAIRLLSSQVMPDRGFWYLKMDLSFNCSDSLNRFNRLLRTVL